MSTISTGGSDARRRARAAAARRSARTLSGRGVALPATQHRAAARPRASGDAAGVVARVALVLVGGVVLLVDDDQPESVDRREDRRARADADARLAARAGAATRRGARRRESLECRTATVSPKRSTKRETICGVSAISGTSTIAPRPCASAAAAALQVDLGLARAGDAVQQQRAPARARDRRLDLGERGRLVGGQRRGCGAPRADGACVGARRTARRSSATSPRRLQAAQRGEVAAGDARGSRREQRALALGGRRRRRRRRRLAPTSARFAFAPGGRRDERERAGRRRAVLARHPAARARRARAAGRLEHRARRDEPSSAQLGALGDADDDAERRRGGRTARRAPTPRRRPPGAGSRTARAAHGPS